MKRFFLIISLSLLLFFSACTVISVDGELNLEANEKWSMSITALLPGEDAAFLELMDEEELMSSMSDYGMAESDLPEDVSFDVKVLDKDSDGNVPLVMSFSGESYDSLNGMGERTIWTETVNGKDITYFRMEGMGNDMGMGAQSTSFTLNANGNITETNGELQGSKTAVWYDFADDMTATIEPGGASFLDLSDLGISVGKTEMMIITGVLCCLCLIVIVIVVVVIVLVTRNKKKKAEADSAGAAPASPAADSDQTTQV